MFRNDRSKCADAAPNKLQLNAVERKLKNLSQWITLNYRLIERQ